MLNNSKIYNTHELDSCHHKIKNNYTELIVLFQDQNLNVTKEIKHLIQFTIINRLMILDLNCSKLFKSSIREAEKPYAYDSTEISMNLNSFYFHISGFIDNLAWYLEYALELLDIKIDNPKNRTKIGLHKNKKDFMNKLKDKNINLYNLITDYQDWFKELNKKRDPVAHRKPIYVPPTTIVNDIQQFKPISYLDDNFIPIIDSLVLDNENLFNLCSYIIKIINHQIH